MKKLILLIFITFLLTSCGLKEDDTKTETNIKKSDIIKERTKGKTLSNFIIETKNINNFENTYFLEKSGKILATQLIDVKSQTSGDINKIYVKEGDNVSKNQILVSLNDNFSSKGLALEKSKINLEKSKINYESKVLSLDKSIADTKNNLDKIKADLRIEKSRLEQDIKKAKLDYINSISGNNDKIVGYINDTKKQYIDIKIFIYDIIDFSDKILGVTDKNYYFNDSFENYLGAKNTNLKTITESNLKVLINYYETLVDLNSDINEVNIRDYLLKFDEGYSLIIVLLDNLEETLNSSVVSSNFSQSKIDSYINSTDLYQSNNQSKYNYFLSLKSNINTFLNTYKESDDLVFSSSNLLDGTTNLEINYNKTILSIKDSINTLENQLTTAELSYKNALQNKNITLKAYNNDIESSKNNYDSLLVEFSKLSIRSPINGIVGNINVDVASYVGNGANILNIVGDSNTEVELSVSKDELNLLSLNDKVKVEYNNTIFIGSIYSISAVADDNLNYRVKIILNDKIILTGGVVSVIFDIELNDKLLLPINSVSVIGGNIGNINLYINGKLKELKVSLGKVYNDKIEIIGKYNSENEIISFEGNPEVILTDLRKYNPEKNILIKKGKEYFTDKVKKNKH